MPGMSIARRNLLQDKVRFFLSVLGISLAVMLILVLSGFLGGVYKQATAYLDNTPGSVVVVQEGLSNFFSTSSSLPNEAYERVKRAQGVARVIPVTSQIAIFEMHGKKLGAQMIGYDPTLGGGPWKLGEGREAQSDSEAVVDNALAQSHGIALGDRITLQGKDFTVVGTSEGTSLWAASLVFMRKSALQSLLGSPDATSILLVTPSPGLSPAALLGRLDDLHLAGAAVMLKSDMAVNDTKLFARIYNGPLWLMVLIAFLVGALVVGLVIYTATIERQREYGVLKALGARNGLLYRVVTAQALISSIAGSILGTGLALGVARLIMALRPQFLVFIQFEAIGWAVLAGLAMALFGSLLPARTVARLAPAEVFRR